MTELDYEEHYESAEQEQQATARAEAVLAPLAAKARALRGQRDAKLRADALREAAEQLLATDLGPRPGRSEDYANGWSDATHRAHSHLLRLADETQAEPERSTP